jgi:prevent-host-death family protein
MPEFAITSEEMRRNLDRYLSRVRSGETLVITDAGLPVAELKPVEARPLGMRPYALAEGEFRVPDDFDAALPEEVLTAFEGR